MSVELKAGDQVGLLTLLKPGEVRETEKGRALPTWLCLCSCGKQAIRTVDRLRYSLNYDKESCCRECCNELYQGMRYDTRIRRRASNHEGFSWLLENTGKLYSLNWELNELEVLREAAGLPPTLEGPMPSPMRREDYYESPDCTVCQRMADFKRVGKGVFGCSHCPAALEGAMWCRICGAVVCWDCLNAEKHTHHYRESMTWKAKAPKALRRIPPGDRVPRTKS